MRVRYIFQIVLVSVMLRLSAFSAPNPEWTAPLAPFRIADNVFYVGSRDLAAYLITTPAGNILINANLESSPAQIRASIEQLGFKWTNVKILLNSQAHYDHVAGAAQVLRETGARDMVMQGDDDVVRTGGHADFSFGHDDLLTYPPARVDRVLHDGDTVKLGGVVLTAHKTAGHTRGCTTWTLRSHLPTDPAATLRNIVIVGGLAPLSEYRLLDRLGQPASYPGILQDFRHSYTTLHALPCDVFLGAHGLYFDMLQKLARLPAEKETVWIDPKGYAAFIDQAEKNFNRNPGNPSKPQLADKSPGARRATNPSLFSITWIASSLSSTSKNFRPFRAAATPVVPLPAKKSITRSPGRE